jgi:adenylate cyclase class 2
MPEPLHSNLELKARCADLAAARAAVLRLRARSTEPLLQIDTYFPVPSGRLKLRWTRGQAAQLIWYDRPDQSKARISRYSLVPVTDAEGLKAALTAALGVRGEVRKQREVWWWHNVRIHLDEVAGLGQFVEFEAVLSPDETEAASRSRLDELCRELNYAPGPTRTCSGCKVAGTLRVPSA